MNMTFDQVHNIASRFIESPQLQLGALMIVLVNFVTFIGSTA